ncbi:MAG: hypothetical protein KGL39_45690 [Patescibacteria group bacterium]|nr:hypothetical protein [Patescibacteria group bacterium]
MKAHKKLMNALKSAEANRGKVKLADWLKTQPGSTRRGVYRRNFALPEYVIH